MKKNSSAFSCALRGCKVDFREALLWLAAALPLFSACAWGPGVSVNQIPSSHKDAARLGHISPNAVFLHFLKMFSLFGYSEALEVRASI